MPSSIATLPRSPSQATPNSPPATPPAEPAKNVRSLSGLVPFLRPYSGRIALAALFLVMAAVSTLVFPIA
ncbi:MAG: ABC transporter, partial [Pseudorhodobacter sp.]|nr:ABC transporter [Rhizobacter sp.]